MRACDQNPLGNHNSSNKDEYSPQDKLYKYSSDQTLHRSPTLLNNLSHSNHGDKFNQGHNHHLKCKQVGVPAREDPRRPMVFHQVKVSHTWSQRHHPATISVGAVWTVEFEENGVRAWLHQVWEAAVTVDNRASISIEVSVPIHMEEIQRPAPTLVRRADLALARLVSRSRSIVPMISSLRLDQVKWLCMSHLELRMSRLLSVSWVSYLFRIVFELS